MMTYVRVAMVALMIAMSAGCTSDGNEHDRQTEGISEQSPGDGATGERSEDSAMPSHDPPRGFKKAFDLNGPVAYLVKGDVLYTVWGAKDIIRGASEPQIAAFSMVTGDKLASVRPAQEVETPPDGLKHAMTAFADIGGQTSLLLAYSYTIKGVGTVKDRTVLRVRADRVETGSLVWSKDIDSPKGSLGIVNIPAVNSEYTLIRTSKNRTVIVRTASGELVHDWPEFRGYAMVGDVAVGTYREGRTGIIEGRSMRTGRPLWTRRGIDLDDDEERSRELSNGYVLQTTSGDGALIIAAATGATLLHVGKGRGGSRLYCKDDDAGLVLCADGWGEYLSGRFLVAYDLNSGKQLWTVDGIGKERTIPLAVGCIYKGVAYMSFSDNERPDKDRPPMALDVRTGDDLVNDLPAAMDEVGSGYGIAYGWNSLVEAYSPLVVYHSTQ